MCCLVWPQNGMCADCLHLTCFCFLCLFFLEDGGGVGATPSSHVKLRQSIKATLSFVQSAFVFSQYWRLHLSFSSLLAICVLVLSMPALSDETYNESLVCGLLYNEKWPLCLDYLALLAPSASLLGPDGRGPEQTKEMRYHIKLKHSVALVYLSHEQLQRRGPLFWFSQKSMITNFFYYK